MKLWTVKRFVRGFASRDALWVGGRSLFRQGNRKLRQGEIELAVRVIDFKVSHHGVRKQSTASA